MKNRFTEEQIIKALKKSMREAGLPPTLSVNLELLNRLFTTGSANTEI